MGGSLKRGGACDHEPVGKTVFGIVGYNDEGSFRSVLEQQKTNPEKIPFWKHSADGLELVPPFKKLATFPTNETSQSQAKSIFSSDSQPQAMPSVRNNENSSSLTVICGFGSEMAAIRQPSISCQCGGCIAAADCLCSFWKCQLEADGR
ncbi:hypothetical protein [Rhizobium ruizarguesonis]|uniref:hypothetical protein n=1 Tax=Rhizobium ruizarguesonis TaxID=2081791 RepID=UPI0010300DC7|nr:hypothetical protein [Rhizobium ruizarguesonis]TBD81045.1 hypothetical protein ELH11_14655 [Rhizobium ruizarguesonis]TBE12206.1 hypothetical protein ELH09_14735 [Rhizobium ruizarguesonis]WSH32167.1 hypothetical protein U8P70_16585 [Rhizobium ruizarguesonis]